MIRFMRIILPLVLLIWSCNGREYRSHSGIGNNLANPSYGSVGSQMRRFFPAFYNGTGGDTLRQSVTDVNQALPPARVITNTLYTHARAANTRFVSDFHSMFAGFIFPESVGSLTVGNVQPATPNPVPANDSFLDPAGTGTVTMPFRRYQPLPGTGTSVANPRQFGTRVTTDLDLSNIYGYADDNTVSTPAALNVRTFVGGLLAVDPIQYNPPAIVPNQGNWRLAGHFQTNHLPQVVSMDHVFRREHNRRATLLAAQNPTWNDTILYEEARRMTIAIYQKISTREYLATLDGAPLPPYAGYNASMDPRNMIEFNAAVFRYVHTEMNTQSWRLNADNTFMSSDGEVPMTECIWKGLLHNNVDGDTESWMRGMAAQVQRTIAPHLPDALRNTNVMGPRVQNIPAQDVGVLDIMRGRDVGLPPYNLALAYLSLPTHADFDSISSDPQIVADLRALYRDVNDIDFIIGMLAEDHLPGSSTGVLLKCMLQIQFLAWRDGDRFWYENPNYFTANETAEIYEMNWQTLLYANTNITSIQPNVFFTTSFSPSPLQPSDLATTTVFEHSTLLSPAYLLSWTVDGLFIHIEVRVAALGWIGIGWEPQLNTMKGGDIALCRVFDNGTVQVVDSYARDVGIPVPDVSFPGGTDDITQVSGFRQDGITIIRFTRPMAATDRWDHPVGRLGQTTQKIMYAFHLTAIDYSYHGPNRDDPYFNWQLDASTTTIVEDSDNLAMGLIIITAVFSIFPALTLGLVVRHRNHPRIRAATFSFCVLICVGVFLGFAAVFVMMVTQDATTCNLGFFLAGAAYVLVYQSILFKTWRIHRIFNREHNLKQQVVSTRTLGLYVIVALVMEMAFDIIWVLVDPEMIGYQASGTQLLRTCVSTNNDAFLYAWILYKLVFLVVGAYLAYRVRDVHEQYNESNALGNSIYITMVIAILCLVLGMILRAAPNVGLVVRWASLTFALTFTLATHFAPKFIAIYNNTVSPMGTQLASTQLHAPGSVHPIGGGTNGIGSPASQDKHLLLAQSPGIGSGHNAFQLNVNAASPGGAPRSPGLPVPRAAFGNNSARGSTSSGQGNNNSGTPATHNRGGSGGGGGGGGISGAVKTGSSPIPSSPSPQLSATTLATINGIPSINNGHGIASTTTTIPHNGSGGAGTQQQQSPMIVIANAE